MPEKADRYNNLVDEIADIYDKIGSDQPFYELVDRFYEGVERTPRLRKLYPDDLEPGKKHLAWFLIQRFGGPSHFTMNRGAPMLRRRHFAFEIDSAARDAWVENMMAAIDVVPAFAAYHAIAETYFADAATFLVNRAEPPTGSQLLNQI